jgi:hypothetical protein
MNLQSCRIDSLRYRTQRSIRIDNTRPQYLYCVETTIIFATVFQYGTRCLLACYGCNNKRVQLLFFVYA